LLEDTEAVYAFLKEPNAQMLLELGLSPPAQHQALTKEFHEALEGLPAGNLKQLAAKLLRLSQENPWHSLAEAAAFAAITASHSFKNCKEVLEAGVAFVQAWPRGSYAPEVWLYMAFCQKQSGQEAEFEETLVFVGRNYPQTPAGLKAKVELGLRQGISE